MRKNENKKVGSSDKIKDQGRLRIMIDKPFFTKISPIKLAWLAFKYKKCPNCGSKTVGNGEGTFEISDRYLKRTCKCGFQFDSANAISVEIYPN
ncbi:DUF3797 domain-containing protein [Bacillus gobiensis]|uniref:DUF3797 domain-containing protein n=1 Tax=Bacillus gobiensis TaxID=1441095 RepID=UPI003D1D36ED